MKIIYLLLALALASPAWAAPVITDSNGKATVMSSSPTYDFSPIINGLVTNAHDGDTINLTSGTFNANSTITLKTGVKLVIAPGATLVTAKNITLIQYPSGGYRTGVTGGGKIKGALKFANMSSITYSGSTFTTKTGGGDTFAVGDCVGSSAIGPDDKTCWPIASVSGRTYTITGTFPAAGGLASCNLGACTAYPYAGVAQTPIGTYSYVPLISATGTKVFLENVEINRAPGYALNSAGYNGFDVSNVRLTEIGKEQFQLSTGTGGANAKNGHIDHLRADTSIDLGKSALNLASVNNGATMTGTMLNDIVITGASDNGINVWGSVQFQLTHSNITAQIYTLEGTFNNSIIAGDNIFTTSSSGGGNIWLNKASVSAAFPGYTDAYATGNSVFGSNILTNGSITGDSAHVGMIADGVKLLTSNTGISFEPTSSSITNCKIGTMYDLPGQSGYHLSVFDAKVIKHNQVLGTNISNGAADFNVWVEAGGDVFGNDLPSAVPVRNSNFYSGYIATGAKVKENMLSGSATPNIGTADDAGGSTTGPNSDISGNLWSNGSVLKPAGSSRRTIYGTAPPVSGAFVKGDKLYNTAPAVGSPLYWVCTTAGSPGTWTTDADLMNGQFNANGYILTAQSAKFNQLKFANSGSVGNSPYMNYFGAATAYNGTDFAGVSDGANNAGWNFAQSVFDGTLHVGIYPNTGNTTPTRAPGGSTGTLEIPNLSVLGKITFPATTQLTKVGTTDGVYADIYGMANTTGIVVGMPVTGTGVTGGTTVTAVYGTSVNVSTIPTAQTGVTYTFGTSGSVVALCRKTSGDVGYGTPTEITAGTCH